MPGCNASELAESLAIRDPADVNAFPAVTPERYTNSFTSCGYET